MQSHFPTLDKYIKERSSHIKYNMSPSSYNMSSTITEIWKKTELAREAAQTSTKTAVRQYQEVLVLMNNLIKQIDREQQEVERMLLEPQEPPSGPLPASGKKIELGCNPKTAESTEGDKRVTTEIKRDTDGIASNIDTARKFAQMGNYDTSLYFYQRVLEETEHLLQKIRNELDQVRRWNPNRCITRRKRGRGRRGRSRETIRRI